MSVATHSNKNGAMLKRSIDRFWSKVIVPTDKMECYEWNGYKDKDGYGRHRPGTGKNYVGAHRFSWELSGGSIPEGMHVLHRCDNRGCVNPVHLFLGSNLDNVKDMTRKERQNRGSKHPNAVLNEKLAGEIKQLLAHGVPQKKLARMYGVSRDTIRGIYRGQSWKHITLTPNEATE